MEQTQSIQYKILSRDIVAKRDHSMTSCPYTQNNSNRGILCYVKSRSLSLAVKSLALPPDLQSCERVRRLQTK